ncbi:MAG: hypothetical protein F6K58_32620 [Symploca sp. SIO2E9]|nr:hypothetical protein [Symploca sp. SIO2E9]
MKPSGNERKSEVKVVRVTRTEFELSDGRVFPHVVELDEDEVPTPEEFQEIHDYWKFTLTTDGRNSINNK